MPRSPATRIFQHMLQPRGADGHAVVWALVLTYGGQEEITAACIDSLLAADHPALRILLIDNDSFDGSGARLRDRYPQIAYLNTGGNLGYAGGNNRGIAFALERGADYLLVINNDTVIEPSCITRLVEVAESRNDIGAVAPKILYYDAPDRIWFGGGRFSRVRVMGQHLREMDLDDPAEPPREEPITFVTGCCFLMPTAVARAVGSFDERFFMYAEDLDLSLRMQVAGLSLLYQPAARVYHRQPPNAEGKPWQVRFRDRNRRLIAASHYGVLERLRFYAFFYPSRAVRFAQYVGRGKWAHARAIIAGAFGR